MPRIRKILKKGIVTLRKAAKIAKPKIQSGLKTFKQKKKILKPKIKKLRKKARGRATEIEKSLITRRSDFRMRLSR